MFQRKSRMLRVRHRGDRSEIVRYLDTAAHLTQQMLRQGGCLIADPDNELTVRDVLERGPEIACQGADADLPDGIATWVRHEAAYRVAVAYARSRNLRLARGNDTAVTAAIDELSGQPLETQAEFLNRAARLP